MLAWSSVLVVKARAGESPETAAMRELAEEGKAEAQWNLGVRYLDGRDGLPTDEAAALAWVQKAAAQSHPGAYMTLGYMNQFGKGLTKSIPDAVKNYRKSMDLGNLLAAVRLGDLYDAEKDAVKAAQWYTYAAARGQYEAQGKLGRLYAEGRGVEKDPVFAFSWMMLASQHGAGETFKADLLRLAPTLTPEQLAEGTQMMIDFRPQGAASSTPAAEAARRQEMFAKSTPAFVPGQSPEHQVLTIERVTWKQAVPVPAFLPQANLPPVVPSEHSNITAELHPQEWFEDQDHGQYRRFLDKADRNFILRSTGRRDIPATVSGAIATSESITNGKRTSDRSISLDITLADYTRMTPGAAYTLVPLNADAEVRWIISPGATLTVPRQNP